MATEEDAVENLAVAQDPLSDEYEDFFAHTPFFVDSYPAVDIKEKKDCYILEAELPGLTGTDVLVKIDEKLITLQSNQEDGETERDYIYLLKERRKPSFSRSFTIPNDVENKNISISFRDGLLCIMLAKTRKA
ncbi:MAG: Hsp20/alpha crystallin family protein [Spirochaetales bacterium]|nr:Hsp20/alpha crystallin family protein [Spirochaetales bacterium]